MLYPMRTGCHRDVERSRLPQHRESNRRAAIGLFYKHLRRRITRYPERRVKRNGRPELERPSGKSLQRSRNARLPLKSVRYTQLPDQEQTIAVWLQKANSSAAGCAMA